MILFLSIKDSRIIICLVDKDRMVYKGEITEHNENTVALVDKALKSAGIKLKNIKAVVVGATDSGFTASRALIALANALGLALNVKVIKIKNSFEENKDFIKQMRKSLGSQKLGKIASPEYSGPVSITLST